MKACLSRLAYPLQSAVCPVVLIAILQQTPNATGVILRSARVAAVEDGSQLKKLHLM